MRLKYKDQDLSQDWHESKVNEVKMTVSLVYQNINSWKNWPKMIILVRKADFMAVQVMRLKYKSQDLSQDGLGIEDTHLLLHVGAPGWIKSSDIR